MSASKLALAVTTSTGVTGVAVGPTAVTGGARSADDVVSRLITTDRRHAEELIPMIQQVLGEAGRSMAELELLVADIGPGRFTGLRVGVATVRALAFGRGLPVVGLTSLQILAAGVASGSEGHGAVTAVVDARRGEVFQQSFTVADPPVANGEPRVGPASELAAGALGVVAGDGADLYAEEYRSTGVVGTVVGEGYNPDPAVMLALAGAAEPIVGSQLAPLYLRAPDVNPNVKTRPVADRTADPARTGNTATGQPGSS